MLIVSSVSSRCEAKPCKSPAKRFALVLFVLWTHFSAINSVVKALQYFAATFFLHRYVRKLIWGGGSEPAWPSATGLFLGYCLVILKMVLPLSNKNSFPREGAVCIAKWLS